MTYGTAYFDLEADPAFFERTVRALAEGNSIQGTARIVQIDKDPVCAWLNRAAHPCRRVMWSPGRDLPVTECPLDEWWSFVHTQEQNLTAARRGCETEGDAGVWVAFAPGWRLGVAWVVGQRTQEQANLLLDRGVSVTDDRVPFFTSDPWPGYPAAWRHAEGEWYQPERQGQRGRHPAPRCRPPPNLWYAPGVKRREKGRVVEVTRKIVWGSADEIQARWAGSPTRTTINTRFVERDQRAGREHHRRLTRKTTAFSKEWPWMEKPLWLSLAYYPFCLPPSACVRNGPHRNRPEVPDRPAEGGPSPRPWRWA